MFAEIILVCSLVSLALLVPVLALNYESAGSNRRRRRTKR